MNSDHASGLQTQLYFAKTTVCLLPKCYQLSSVESERRVIMKYIFLIFNKFLQEFFKFLHTHLKASNVA
jgi:hypothetical protein